MSPIVKISPSAPPVATSRGAAAGPAADGPTHPLGAPDPSASAVDAASSAALMTTLREQGATLRRLEATLEQLLRRLNPVAAPGDSASAPGAAAADPMGAGYTLSQRALAEALAIPASYVSTLVRAFKLDEDPRYALTVRPGTKRLVNYHPRAIERFRELVRCPPDALDHRALRTVEQVRSRLGDPARAA